MTKHSHIPSECQVVSCQVQATCRYLNFLTAFLLPLCCIQVANIQVMRIMNKMVTKDKMS